MITFYQKVTQEDIDLCNAAQQNLQRGIYVSGPLHPFHEEGVLAFQNMVKKVLTNHLDHEQKAGRQIWPAERKQDGPEQMDETCAKILACNSRSDLNW